MEDTEARVAKKARKGDTSVDVHSAEASAPAEQHTGEAAAPSQQTQAQELFGQQLQILALKKVYQKLQALQHSVLLNAGAGLQGPAGVRTEGPPGDDEPMTAHGDVDLEPGAAERPEGIVGPSGGPLDDPDTAGTAEAEQAAADAHDRTDEPDDIMDALEAAEAKYDKAHPEEAAGPGNTAEALDASQQAGKSSSASMAAAPGVPAHASKGIDQDIRDHAEGQICAALKENKSVEQAQAGKSAKDIEQRCYDRASTAGNARTMYHNLAAHATRLARTEKDLASIARVAAGEPKAVADGSITEGQEPGDVAAGLQGYVDKPRHAVG